MARKRMIDPNMWESEDVSKLTMTERVLLVGLISNADDYGKGRANPARVRSVVFQYDDIPVDDVREMLANISRHVEIIFYEIDGSEYYKFTNWRKWQKLDHPTESRIPEPFEGVRELYANESRESSDELAPNRIEKNRKEKKGKEENVCAEPEASAPLPVISIPLNDKTEYPIKQVQVDEWSELYPAVNVMQELKNYRGWALSTPKKRKTKSGILRSINTWLKKEQDKGGARASPQGYRKKLDGLKYDQRPPGEDGLDKDFDDMPPDGKGG